MIDPQKIIKANRQNTLLPRYPQRSNGRARFQSLLDTLEEMLQNSSLADINLAELGKRAGAKTASVYHFFPSKEAAVIALAERFLENYYALAEAAGQKDAKNWQEIFDNCGNSALAYNEKNPLAMEVFFGRHGSWRILEIDIASRRKFAKIIADACRRQFAMEPINDLESLFTTAITISDSIWALSYAEHKRITDAYAEEARRAVSSYLKLYLPDFMPKK